MIDERIASWRYFLGLEKFNRVLLIGGDLGLLSGIAKVSDRLECISLTENSALCQSLDSKNITFLDSFDEISDKYSLIILATNSLSDQLVEDLPVLFLDDLGSIVFLPGIYNASKHKCLRSSFKVERYAALPPNNPRIFFPLDNHDLRKKGLTFHTPGSLKGILVIKFLLLISSMGCSWTRLFNAVVFVHYSSHQFDSETLLCWLNSKLEVSLSGLVIYAGSNSVNRKLTFLAVCDENKDYVVKVGDTVAGIDAIRKETVALNELRNSEINEFIPSVIYEGKFTDGSWVQVQDVSPIKQKKQAKELTELHLNFLSKLAVIETDEILIKDCVLWKECSSMMTGINSEIIKHLFLLIQQRVSADCRVYIHRVHGDFAPWNIQNDLHDLYIYDWEDSRPDGWMGSDLIHFVYRQANLVGPWLGADRIFKEINRHFNRLMEMTRLTADIDQVVGLWIIYEFARQPSEHLEELAEFLVARGNL